MRLIAITALLFAATSAHATPAADVEAAFRALADYTNYEAASPRFAMSNLEVQATADDLAGAHQELGDSDTVTDKVAVALTADGAAAWLAVDQREVGDCGGDGPGCGKTLMTRKVGAVFERGKDGWLPVVWDVANDVSDAQQQGALGDGKQLAAIAPAVDGADDAVRLFTSTIGDPKALAGTWSVRKDVVLLGSSTGEHYAGAAAKAKLAAWRLAFKVHDGVRAGVTSNGALAWVAASVDAAPAGKPKAKATPYRALFVYLRARDRWELVLAQFSFGT